MESNGKVPDFIVDLVLGYDPFEGDKNGPDRIVSRTIHQARKVLDGCTWCRAKIFPGQFYHKLVFVDEGQLIAGKEHAHCIAEEELERGWLRPEKSKIVKDFVQQQKSVARPHA